jgi:hypothetical protein
MTAIPVVSAGALLPAIRVSNSTWSELMHVPDVGPAGGPSSAQYEFSAEQDKTISGVALGFRVFGVVLAITTFKAGYHLVLGLLHRAGAGGRPATDYDLVEYVGLLILFLPLAVCFYQASFAFQAVAETKGRDIDNLMTGLTALRRSFRWAIGLALLALVVCLLAPALRWAGVL